MQEMDSESANFDVASMQSGTLNLWIVSKLIQTGKRSNQLRGHIIFNLYEYSH